MLGSERLRAVNRTVICSIAVRAVFATTLFVEVVDASFRARRPSRRSFVAVPTGRGRRRRLIRTELDPSSAGLLVPVPMRAAPVLTPSCASGEPVFPALRVLPDRPIAVANEQPVVVVMRVDRWLPVLDL